MEEKIVNPNEVARKAAEAAIQSLTKALRQELAVNDAQTNPERRVNTALLVVTDEDRFLALDGTAHQMRSCFVQLFQRRPELRSVVQEVLNEMFRIEDR